MKKESLSSGNAPFRILSLDGGGAKGFYTLGILAEIEAMLGQPLHTRFDLLFGTRTGAIIAALLARGESVATVQKLYEEHVPTIMKAANTAKRTRALQTLANSVFEKQTYPVYRLPPSRQRLGG